MYFVTSIKHPCDEEIVKFLMTDDARCWGYFSTEHQALDAVSNNAGDMQEIYYNWIVIEQITDNINPKKIKDIWFKWDSDIEKWVHHNKPKWTQHIQKWAIG